MLIDFLSIQILALNWAGLLLSLNNLSICQFFVAENPSVCFFNLSYMFFMIPQALIILKMI